MFIDDEEFESWLKDLGLLHRRSYCYGNQIIQNYLLVIVYLTNSIFFRLQEYRNGQIDYMFLFLFSTDAPYYDTDTYDFLDTTIRH